MDRSIEDREIEAFLDKFQDFESFLGEHNAVYIRINDHLCVSISKNVYHNPSTIVTCISSWRDGHIYCCSNSRMLENGTYNPRDYLSMVVKLGVSRFRDSHDYCGTSEYDACTVSDYIYWKDVLK